MINNLEKFLADFTRKSVTVTQDGYLKSKCLIKELDYFIEYDILNIIDKQSQIYQKINLNQIYKIENSNNEIIFYLDNDTNISIKK